MIQIQQHNDNVIQLMTIFEDIDQIINNYIDKVEINPILIKDDTYVCGIQRTLTQNDTVLIHIKQIKTIKLNNNENNNTETLYMIEPYTDMYIDATLIEQNIIQQIITEIKNIINNITEIVLAITKYKDKQDTYSHIIITAYQNKKIACKDILRFRKIHQNVTTKFETYNKQGQIIYTNQKTQKQIDFELITAK